MTRLHLKKETNSLKYNNITISNKANFCQISLSEAGIKKKKERIKSGSAKCSMIDDRKNGLRLPTESLGVVG